MNSVSLVISALFSALVVSATAGEAITNVSEQVGFDQKINARVPLDLHFKDENGRDTTLDHYFGRKPVLLTLVYYQCPMLCTEVLNGLTRSLKPLASNVGNEFDILTVSIDPRDLPSLAARKKKNYLRQLHRPHAEQGWHWLTGAEKEIEKLTQSVGFRYRYDERTKQYAHAAGFVVLTPSGKISRYFFGIDFSPNELQTALAEAQEERSGRLVHDLLLLCFHYDPATGKYSLAIIKILRIAGVVTVLAIVGRIVSMLRMERKNSIRLVSGEGAS